MGFLKKACREQLFLMELVEREFLAKEGSCGETTKTLATEGVKEVENRKRDVDVKVNEEVWCIHCNELFDVGDNEELWCRWHSGTCGVSFRFQVANLNNRQ